MIMWAKVLMMKEIVLIFRKPSFSKSTPGGFDSNTGSNQGWFPRGIQLPKIDMRKFDGKDPITWILQME